MTSVKVAIVGLGRIGARYASADGVPRNHVAAVLATPGLALSAVVDEDPAAREASREIAAAAGARMLESIAELEAGVAEVLVDATGSPDRRPVLAAAQRIGARLVVVEKPVAADLPGAVALAEAADGSGLTVRVNFQRRLDARHASLKPDEAPALVQGAYAKGLLNYGSHLVDLLLDWMGPVEAVRAHGDAAEGDDPSIGFDIRFRNGGTGSIAALPGLGWDVFELTFFGRFGRIDLHNGGANLSQALPMPDAIYPGYTHLVANDMPTAPVAGLAELHAAAREHVLAGAAMPGTTPREAVLGLAIIDAVRRSASTGCGWQVPRLNA